MAVDRTSNSTHTVNTSTDSDLLVVNGVITYANGTVFYDIGSNVENLAVFGNTSINVIVANNSMGMQGQVLTTNGPDTGIYWSTVSAGNTTVMTAGDGLYQNTTHYYVNANTGIIANSVGTFVDASYIANIAANSASYIGNSIAAASYTNITNWISGNAATAYTNAATLAGTAYTNATSYADTKAGTAYSNATAYADTKAGTAYSNGTAYADSKASIAYSNAITYSIADATARAATAYANAVADAASDASTKAATAYSNAVSNAAALYAPLAGATFTGAISAPNVTTTSNTLTIGTAAYHVANGNLGIGTASPASKLAVSGTVSAGNTSLSGSLSLSDRINQTGTVTSSAGYIQLGGQLNVGSNTQQNMFTMQSSVSLQGNGTLPSLYGLLFLPTMVISANNVTNLYAVFARVDTDVTYTGTIGTYTAFVAATPSLGGSTPNNIYQFVAQNATATTGVIGFRSQITSGTGKWNFYAVGTANNYMAGGLGIGTTTLTQPLTVTGNADIGGNIFVTSAVNAASHTVGTAFIANSTGVTTTGFANVSANVYVGNATVYTYTNATSFSGTANNATNFGGLSLATVQGQITGNASTAYANAIATAATDASTKAGTAYANAVANAAALYQTTAGLSANVLTLSANLAMYLGNSATTGANVASWISGNAATAYTNATSYADTQAGNAYANAVANAAALYAPLAGATFTGAISAPNVTTTSNTLTIGTAAYHVANGNLGIGNTTPADKLTIGGSLYVSGNTNFIGTNNFFNTIGQFNAGIWRSTSAGPAYWMQQDGTGRSHWYWNTSGGSSPTFVTAAEDASALSLSITNSGAGGTLLHRSASGVGKIAGDAITWTNTLYVDLTSITWKGTAIAVANGSTYNLVANNSTNFGGLSLATVQGQITGNSATAYSNAVATAATDASTKAGTAYTNATSYAATIAGTAYTNAIAVAATDASTKAGTAYTNATTFSANASNISNGTLAEPRLPYRMDQNVTTTSVVTFSNLTLTGNLYVNGQITTIGANNLTITDNMIYLNNGVEANVTNVSGNGSHVIFTANNNYGLGWDVVVTGVNPTSYNGTYLNIFAVNATSFTVANTNTATYISGGLARGKSDVNPDIGFAAGYNDGTYHHTGFFRRAADNRWYVFNNYDPEPDASIYIDVTNTSFKVADLQANTMYLGNTTVYGTVNTTIYTGTANAATYHGNSSGTIANVASWITGNASVAYTNATSYAATIAGTAYTNAIAIAATDATNKAANAYSNAVSIASTDASNKAANAYSNAVTAAATAAAGIYQTTAGLAANVLTLTSNNATNFGGYTWASPGALGTTAANSGNFTTVNAASHTVGTSFIANATAITTTGLINSNGTITTTSATGKIILATDSGGAISLGRTDGVASAPYIDFNSGATYVDYDARIAASSGNGTVGAATVTISSGELTTTSNTLTIGTAAYVIASGNVGIGTASPSSKLHVAGNVFVSGGNMGIGTSVSATSTLALSKNLTGGTSAQGVAQNGTIQSDVTTAARGYYNTLNVANNTTFTINNVYHYGTINGRPSALNTTINSLHGYLADSSLVSGISNYGFLGSLPASSAFTITNVSLTTNVVTITTSAAHNFWPGQNVIVAATTTTSINGSFTVLTSPSTTTFTYALVLGDIVSTADTGTVTVSTGRWNTYMLGTAPNHFLGQVTIGTTNITNGYLAVAGTQSGATAMSFIGGTNQSTSTSPTGLTISSTLTGTTAMTNAYGISLVPTGAFAAGATVSNFGGINNNPNLASAVTPTNYWGTLSSLSFGAAALGGTVTVAATYQASAPFFNAATTTNVTTYAAFRAASAANGALNTITNIYAFQGQQATSASSNAYNLFMSGTAKNYLAGNTGIGNTLPDATLAVTGTANISGAVTLGSTLAVTGTANITGNVTLGSTLAVTGTANVSGAVTLGSTLAAGNTTFTGQVIINAGANNLLLTNGTSNWIYWETSGTDAPAFTTRSVGTKLVLYPAIGASAVDYALGINAGTLWSSIPGNDAGQFFKWYGGQTEVASLSGTGNFLIGGSVNAASYTVGSNFIANSIGITTTGFANVSGNTSTNNLAVATKLNVGTAAGYDFGTLAVIEIDSSQNTYVQSVIQNANSGVNASSDLVLTNDTGNDTFNYVNFGINSSTYSNSLYTVVGASDGYLYTSNGALGIGTATAKDIIFHANGTLSTDEKMRISANGNLGIGTNAPIQKLDVLGVALMHSNSTTSISPIIVQNDNTDSNTTKSVNILFSGKDTVGTTKNTGLVTTGPVDGNYIASYMAFSTRSGDTVAERMRITATGNTGIGNTAPNATLAVTGTANISGAVSIGGTLIAPILNVIDASGVANATFISAVKNGTYFLNSQARAPAGAYNNLVTVNDSIMVYSNGTVGYGALSIIPWAGASGGIRLATSANSTTIGLTGNTTLTGTFTHDSATGNYGSSTAAATYQLGYGATTTGVLKTINLGTGGAAGSTTNVNIGSTLSNTFVTINANTVTVTGAITSTRINPRVGTVANTATITPTAGASDQYNVTALGVAATIAIPSGTAVDGQKLTIRIKDNGTARALTWTTSAGGYRVVGTTLPTTTVISKTVYVGCVYNTADTFWDVIAVAQQA